jgi:transposase
VRRERARPFSTIWSAGCAPVSKKWSRKSDTAAAIHYALNLWPALLRYCDDGLIEIDNSAAERALRGVAIGRRNYLFASADRGGERAAAIYSVRTPPSSTLSPRSLAAGMCWSASPTISYSGVL